MRSRSGFVSNSSSTSFIITNISDTPKTLVDFVLENRHLVDLFNEEYDDTVALSDVLGGAEDRMRDDAKGFPPGEDVAMVFGDEQGDTLGRVYDYILREGGTSENFTWRFNEYLR